MTVARVVVLWGLGVGFVWAVVAVGARADARLPH